MSKRSVSGQGELLEAGRHGLMSAGGGGCSGGVGHFWNIRGWCELKHKGITCFGVAGEGSERDQPREVDRWASPKKMFLLCGELPAESSKCDREASFVRMWGYLLKIHHLSHQRLGPGAWRSAF